MENRVRQAEAWMESMSKYLMFPFSMIPFQCSHVSIPEKDHQGAVQRHCDHLMEFQGKMHEASMKFESLEEEHLAQMVTFMIKISQVSRCSLFPGFIALGA